MKLNKENKKEAGIKEKYWGLEPAYMPKEETEEEESNRELRDLSIPF